MYTNELENKKTPLTTHKALHSRDDIDWLYMLRKEGGKGLARTEDHIDISMTQLKDYRKKSKERLITTTRNNTNNTRINRTTITKKQEREEKQLYGYFTQQTREILHEKTWSWLRKETLIEKLNQAKQCHKDKLH